MAFHRKFYDLAPAHCFKKKNEKDKKKKEKKTLNFNAMKKAKKYGCSKIHFF